VCQEIKDKFQLVSDIVSKSSNTTVSLLSIRKLLWISNSNAKEQLADKKAEYARLKGELESEEALVKEAEKSLDFSEAELEARKIERPRLFPQTVACRRCPTKWRNRRWHTSQEAMIFLESP